MGVGRCAEAMATQGLHHGAAAMGGHRDAPAMPVADCPLRRAVLSPLSSLTLLVLLAALAAIAPPAQAAWQRARGSSLPPPLAPARRRALLQVFLN